LRRFPANYFFFFFARYFAQRRFAAWEIALRPAADNRFVRLRPVAFFFAKSVTSAHHARRSSGSPETALPESRVARTSRNSLP